MRALFYQSRAWASLTLGTQSFLPSAAGNNPEPWFGLVSIQHFKCVHVLHDSTLLCYYYTLLGCVDWVFYLGDSF